MLLLHWLSFAESSVTAKQLAHVAAVDFSAVNGPVYDPACSYRDPNEVFVICYGLITEFKGNTVA